MQLCPTRHLLEACQLVARLFESNAPTPRRNLRSAFWNVPIGGRFSVEHLEMAADLLVRVHLVTEDDSELWPSSSLEAFCRLSIDDVAELVLFELLVNEAPLWLRAGMLNGGRFAYEAVPDGVLKRIDALIKDHEQRDAILLEAGYRVDSERRSEIGMMGELAVIEAIEHYYAKYGRADLSVSIRHVSQASDALGYDVACSTLDGSRVRRLEVKTSASCVPIRIFLTRNEVERGLSDPDWRLVVCLLGDDGARVTGWTMPMAFESRLPADSGRAGCRWESASLMLDVAELATGLPLD